MKKKILFGCLFILPIILFAQKQDIEITSTSETVEINCSSSSRLKAATINFVKFSNNEYGIKLFFVAPEMAMSHIIVSNKDSLCMNLSNHKKVVLVNRYRDTAYNMANGNISLGIYYQINRSELTIFKTEELISILLEPEKLMMQKHSRSKIITIANSF